MTESLAGELERLVVDAWPAAETEELDGWLLRASGGPTHRGNSVATLAAGSALSLDQRIARAEQWYRERERTAELLTGIAEGRSTIVIEHDMAFVRMIAHTVTVMHEGKVLAEGSMDEIQADPRVIDVYLGE